ncbi:hypothetical protein OC834_003119 [Tilletia horrida]|nr:hypothetical protein OC834_003119 [Tilletia horrida]KAK0559273.1 hypothetical protein OC844_004530 [Tilletia horrida]
MATPSSLSIRPARLDQADDHFVLTAFDSALPYLASIGSGAQWGDVPFTAKPERVKEMHDFCARSDRVRALEEEQESSAALQQQGSVVQVPRMEWSKLLIAEAHTHMETETETDGTKAIRVAGAGMSLHAPGYVVRALPHIFASPTTLVDRSSTSNHQADDDGKEDDAPPEFAYLNYLIVHRDPLGFDASNSRSQEGPPAPAPAQIFNPSASSLTKGAGALLIKNVAALASSLRPASTASIPLFVDCWDGNGAQLVAYYESQGFVSVGTFAVPDKHGAGMPWTGRLLRMDVAVA